MLTASLSVIDASLMLLVFHLFQPLDDPMEPGARKLSEDP